MFDKRVFFTVVLGFYAVAAISRLLPVASPASVAGYLPSIGSGKTDA